MTRRAHCAPHCYRTNSTRRVWLAHALLLCGASITGRPAFSQEKPQTSTPPPDPFKANAAFKAAVSVEVYYVTVAQLVKQITPPDFPYLLHIAPFDAETPFCLCVKNKSLGEVLQLCAALLNGQWREEKAADNSQKSVYVLEPKPGAVDHEKALYYATLDSSMEAMVQIARLSARHGQSYWQKEYGKVKTVPATVGETSPDKNLLQFLAQSKGSGQAFFSLFAGLTRIQQRTLAEKGYFALPWEAMNTAQQQNALASRHSESRPSPTSAYDMTPEENRAAEQRERASIQRFGLVLSVDKNPVNGRITGVGMGLAGTGSGSLGLTPNWGSVCAARSR